MVRLAGISACIVKRPLSHPLLTTQPYIVLHALFLQNALWNFIECIRCDSIPFDTRIRLFSNSKDFSIAIVYRKTINKFYAPYRPAPPQSCSLSCDALATDCYFWLSSCGSTKFSSPNNTMIASYRDLASIRHTHTQKVHLGGVYKSKYLKVPHALRFRSIPPRFDSVSWLFVYATINYTFNFISLEMPQKYHCPTVPGVVRSIIYILISVYIYPHTYASNIYIDGAIERLEILLGILQNIQYYVYISVF